MFALFVGNIIFIIWRNLIHFHKMMILLRNKNGFYCVIDAILPKMWPLLFVLFPRNTQALKGLVCFEFLTLRCFALLSRASLCLLASRLAKNSKHTQFLKELCVFLAKSGRKVVAAFHSFAV